MNEVSNVNATMTGPKKQKKKKGYIPGPPPSLPSPNRGFTKVQNWHKIAWTISTTIVVVSFTVDREVFGGRGALLINILFVFREWAAFCLRWSNSGLGSDNELLTREIFSNLRKRLLFLSVSPNTHFLAVWPGDPRLEKSLKIIDVAITWL